MSPTNVPTKHPVVVVVVPPQEEDAGVSLTVAMDYSSNSTNKSDTNVIIKELTEEILNSMVGQITNTSNNTKVIVSVCDDVESTKYDIVLTSNYSTNNETAVHLEALFEDTLETELLQKINNDSNIKVNEIDIEINVLRPPHMMTTEALSTDDDDKSDMMLISYIIISCGFCVVCVFIAGIYVGWKLNNKSRQHRVKSAIDDIGNIRNDGEIQQSSDDECYEVV